MSQQESKTTTSKEEIVCDIRIPSSVRTEEVVAAFTELCHKFSLTPKIRGEAGRGAPRTNPEGEIKIFFTDLKLSHTIKDARTARKWLRKHKLSVVDATKSGNQWTFAKANDLVKGSLIKKTKAPVAKAPEAKANAK